MKTAQDFKVNDYAYGRDTITDKGERHYRTGKWEVNYSDILTRLIQEAGRFCERYASDLFISWESVLHWIDEAGDDEKEIFLFGFRQNGVDHNNFILSRYESGMYKHPELEYRSLWRLDVETTENEYGTKIIRLTLGRVF